MCRLLGTLLARPQACDNCANLGGSQVALSWFDVEEFSVEEIRFSIAVVL